MDKDVVLKNLDSYDFSAHKAQLRKTVMYVLKTLIGLKYGQKMAGLFR